MRGNISKSVSLKGDTGERGPQGEKGAKGDTPSIVFEYDKSTGNLYYSSDGALIPKYESFTIESDESASYTTTGLWGSTLKALKFTTNSQAAANPPSMLGGVRIVAANSAHIGHVLPDKTFDIVETLSMAIENGETSADYCVVEGEPYTVRIHNHTEDTVTVNIEEYYCEHENDDDILMKKIFIGNIKGDKGDDGVSVTNVVVNREGHLIIALSNGTTIDTGAVDFEDKFIPEDYALPILYFDGDISGMNKDNAVDLQYRYRFKDESEKDESEKVKYKSGTASVKWQGSSSINYPKKNYTVKFDQAFEPVKGWGAHNKYCMKANWIDFSHARNVVSAKLWGKMCRGTRKEEQEQFKDPLTAGLPNGGAIDGFPIVIVINGEYMGLYSFCIPKDAWMFGLDETNVNHCIIGAGGNNTQTAFKDVPYIEDTTENKPGDFEWEYISDDATYDDRVRFQESLQNLYTNLNAVSSKEELYNLAENNITNIEFFIQYYVYVALLSAYDCITKNYLLFTVDGTKWQISAYDLDSTFGLETNGASFFNVNHKSYAKLADSNMLFRKIYDYAKDRLKAWHNQFVSTIIGNRHVTQEFYNYCKDIPKVYFDEEIKRWTSLPSTNTSNLDQITNYYRLRLEFLQSEVDSW